MIETNCIISFLLFGALIGLCGFFESPYDTSGMDICNDESCLKNNFEECTPSYGNMKTEDYDIYYEVRGLKNDKCEVFIRLDEINLDEVPEELRGIANLAKGSSMLCEVKDEDKSKLINGDFDESMLNNCNGVLANALKTVAPHLK